MDTPRFDIESLSETHRCVRCEQEKPRSDFQPNRRYRSGLNSWCKRCSLDSKMERRARNGVFDKTAPRRVCVDGNYECNSCHEWKAVENFHRSKTRCGVASYCKSCERVKALSKKILDPEGYKLIKQRSAEKRAVYMKDRSLRKMYGITLAQYKILLEVQGGRCAICGFENRCKDNRGLNVDHNHSTGMVRGLLCNKCNLGIGYFSESPKTMRLAIDYLLKHGAK